MRGFLAAALAVALGGIAAAQEFATETGTIQPAGPRPAPNGDNFFNIEGVANGSFASYGTARWDLTDTIGAFDNAFGSGNWEVCKIDLVMTQDNAGFSTTGKILLYYTADDATDAKSGSSPLAYPLEDPNGSLDLPVVLTDPLANYTYMVTGTGVRDVYNIYAKGDTGERATMVADIENSADTTLTLVFNPNDPNTPALAATYSGQGGGTTGFAPELVITAAPLGSNCPPVADAGPDQGVVDVDFNQMENVTLDGSASFATAAGATITDYDWSVGGSTIATGVMPTVSFGLGTTTVLLTITDSNGAMDSDTVIIDVMAGGEPPFADAGAPQDASDSDGDGSASVMLDGSNSSDSDGTITNYTWINRNDGSVLASGASPTATVSLPLGINTVELQVEDNAGHVEKDWTFVKVLPQTVYARHDFDTNLDAALVQNPLPGAFSSAGDGFEVYARAISPTIPFGVLDDTGSAGTGDPNNPECAAFPFDSLGMMPCAKQDAFFGVIDLNNNDNRTSNTCDMGVASFTFNIAGATDIQVSIDMAAMGDFEAVDPNDENLVLCDPNDPNSVPQASPFDYYRWYYSIDGGPSQPLFLSSVDEAGSRDYTLYNDSVQTLNDPLSVNGVALDNLQRTVSAAIAGTGTTLELLFEARTDGGSEAYAFDDIIVFSQPVVEECPGDADGDDDVDLDDLLILLGTFGGPGAADFDDSGTVDLNDLLILLGAFGQPCP